MKKKKYVIVAIKDNCGGAIVLHALCKHLISMDIDAKIFYLNSWCRSDKSFPLVFIYSGLVSIKDTLQKLYNKIRNIESTKQVSMKCPRKYLPVIDKKNTIVVYPEIVSGNFLRAKNVVRWLLFHNHNYKREGDKTIGYDKGDLFFCYRDIFNDETLNPECRKLTITHFDLDTYKRYNFGERKGKCYVIRKGIGRDDLPKTFDGPVIDDLPEKEKVKIFNECEYCISYDTQTAYSKIAALCGCISVVVPEEGKTRRDYRTPNDYDYGEAFGFDESEVEYAKSTAYKALEEYEKSNMAGFAEVKRFVEECEAFFLKNSKK